jgi:hypothetical protein
MCVGVLFLVVGCLVFVVSQTLLFCVVEKKFKVLQNCGQQFAKRGDDHEESPRNGFVFHDLGNITAN